MNEHIPEAVGRIVRSAMNFLEGAYWADRREDYIIIRRVVSP